MPFFGILKLSLFREGATLFFICFVPATLAFGQPSPGNVSGHVSHSGSASRESGNSVVYGTVSSSRKNTPLPNVPVVLQHLETGTVLSLRTTLQGAYIFTNLIPGHYRISVGGGRYSLQTKAGMLGPGTVGRIDFVVTVLSRGSANVTGHVFTGKRGHQTPLSTKILFKNLRKNEIYTVRSDPEGKYSLNQVPDGTYVVQILERGYAPFLKEIQVHGHTTQNFHLINRRIASAEINAVGNSTVRDSTGAITVVGRKNFADNPSTGLGYVLEQTPSVQYYSRSGANGLTGGMNYFMCRGYTDGGDNTAPSSGSNVEFSVEGVPMNNNKDGGLVYDLNLMNTDIQSVDIQRGVTTSQQLGNYASGCAVDIHLVQPSKDPGIQLTSGYGSYGLQYDSFATNTGLSRTYNTAAYNNFTFLNMNGFQEFTSFQEFQDYANLTKYLSNGDVKLLFTGAYKNYDRGSSMSLTDFNTFGPTYNGLPNSENATYPSGVNTPDSPYYHNWISQRYMVSVQSENQITPSISVKNNAFALLDPESVVQVPVVSTGTTPIPGGNGATFNNLVPDYSGSAGSQYGNPFNFSYIAGEGYKVGDIVKSDIKLWSRDTLHLGFRLSYAEALYENQPLLTPNVALDYEQDAENEFLTVGGYLEDHWRPTDQLLLSAGFREMAVSEQYVEQLSGASLNDITSLGGKEGGVTAGENFAVFLPHIGINYYPSEHWKIYASGGQSYSAPAVQFWSGLTSGELPLTIHPEIIDDYQVGSRYETPKGFVALDLYSDYITNMFTTSLVTLPSGATNILPTQAGAANNQGVETEFRYVIGHGFSVDGNYALIHAYYLSAVYGAGTAQEFSNTGDLLPLVPNQLANLDLNYTGGPWHITINERYTGQMNVIDTSGGPSGTCNCQMDAPGFFVTNLLVSYDLPKTALYKKATLFFDAYNLLNTNYYEPAFLTPGAGNVDALFVYPGEPINVFGGVTLTF
jgi:iron complex outermembrane receptor protein|uniref:TonB-dependent receptor n=2 Tax=Leptospirillum TaxID=179 RepID=B6ANZ9_9BACT|nr:MAG: Hypothetical protein CGL2_11276061 [Leptospirillum sp. Group II '5-way CG']